MSLCCKDGHINIPEDQKLFAKPTALANLNIPHESLLPSYPLRESHSFMLSQDCRNLRPHQCISPHSLSRLCVLSKSLKMSSTTGIIPDN